MKNCKPTKVNFRHLIVLLLLFILTIPTLFILQKFCYIPFSSAFAVQKANLPQMWNGSTPLLEGEYYLTHDVRLTQKITIDSGKTVILILNGFALIQDAESACIDVQAGATLYIQNTGDAIPDSPEISVAENTIFTNITTTSPCITAERATLHLKNITVAASMTMENATLIVDTTTFKESEVNGAIFYTEVYLKSSVAEMLKPRVENTFHIIENSQITLSSESPRKGMYFTPTATLNVNTSLLRIDNSKGKGANVAIENLNISGKGTVCEFINCSILGMTATNLYESTIVFTDIIVNATIDFFASSTKFTFKNTTLPAGHYIAFKGEENTFDFTEEKIAGTYRIQADKVTAFSCIGKTVPFDMQVQAIENFTYTQNAYLPKVENLKILNFIVASTSIHIQGESVDGRNISNLQIENLILTTNTTAIFDENSILQNTNIFVGKSNDDNATGSITINYKMENSVSLASAVALTFSENGCLENVKFIGDAKIEDYQEYIDKGYIKFTTNEIKENKNLQSIVIIILLCVIVDILLVWIAIILLLKGKKKAQK